MILKIKKRKKEAVRGGVVFLMAACICLGQAAPVLALDAAWSQKVEITAHRGDSIKALENTIPAFEKAIESGADWIELDVKETRDNVPVVFHDSSLKRLMGQDGTIREMTLEEIKKLHPAASMGPGYNNVKIPTLEETLDTCKGRIKLNIEIKEEGTESSDFTERVIQLIRDKGMTDQCMITSFCYTVLEKVKAVEPSLKTGYIRSKDIEDFSQYPAADQYMLSIELIRKDRVDQIHSLGKKVTAWTVNDLYSLRKCESAQVDDMITDDPGGLLKLDDQ